MLIYAAVSDIESFIPTRWEEIDETLLVIRIVMSSTFISLVSSQ